MAKIAVIVPVYNVEPYLARSLDSILAQTFRDLEIVLVDDGSTDRSGDICEQYAAKDARIRVIHQKNQGLSGARNTGIEASESEYISFIDSDDTITPEMLETLYTGITAYHADIAACNFQNIYSNGETRDLLPKMTSGVKHFGAYDVIYLLQKEFGITFPGNVASGLYKRSILDALHLRFVPTQTIYLEDNLFNFCYYTQVHTAFYDPKPMYLYWHRNDSLTGIAPNPDRTNRMICFTQTLQAFLKQQTDIKQPFSYFAYLAWFFVLRYNQNRSYDEVLAAFTALGKREKNYFRRCLCNLIFGRGGRLYSKKTGVNGRALLYQKWMWLLILLGKYDRPIRTNLMKS